MDATVYDGLWCSACDVHMGIHAERVAAKHNVSREAQDAFALRSHQRALAAQASGAFADEIVPVEVPGRKGPTVVDTDEGPRADTSAEALAKLKPAFQTEGDGTVTAGNAPGITDGAAALVLASSEAVERDGLTPMARITGYAQADVAPEWLFEAPIEGVQRLVDKVGIPLADFDLIEINEAFAAQVLADGNALGFDWDKVNVNGGAVALGHPIGASGARVLTTLLYALRHRGGEARPRDPVPRRRGSGGPRGGAGLAQSGVWANRRAARIIGAPFRRASAGHAPPACHPYLIAKESIRPP